MEPPKPGKKRPAEPTKAEAPAAAENGDGEDAADAGGDKAGVKSSDPDWPHVGELFWGRVKVRQRLRALPFGPPFRFRSVTSSSAHSSGPRLVASTMRRAAQGARGQRCGGAGARMLGPGSGPPPEPLIENGF